jgi:hypothetical protein
LNQNIGAVVPAGKVLVIEDLAASCSKSNQDLPLTVFLRFGVYWKPIPLQLERTLSNGRQTWHASQPSKLYVKAGELVYAAVDAGNNATQLVNCGVRFHGHLVNAN